MIFTLINPDRLTNNIFEKITTDIGRKSFFASFGTTLETYRKVKNGEGITPNVKKIFDEIFKGLERNQIELEYDKYNKRSRDIINSDEYIEFRNNIVNIIKKSKQ